MAICYSGQRLRGIIGLLPRRPFISPHTFSRLKELAIFRQYRGKGSHAFQGQRKIPVRITQNAVLHSADVNKSTCRTFQASRNLVNLSALKKITDTSNLACSLINCRSISNKSEMLNDFICEQSLDCVALTETWLSAQDDNNKVVLSSLLPDNYDIVHVPRPTRGGGVGFVHKKHLKVKVDKTVKSFSSFEHMMVMVEASSFTFRFLVIYRVPPSSKNNIKKSSFIDEFGELLELTSTLSGKIVILGDFNVHMDLTSDHEAVQLSSLLESFGMAQHVSGPTHKEGHTLDLVVTRVDDDLLQNCQTGSFISDHNAVNFSLRSGKHHTDQKKITYRKIKAIDIQKFSQDLQNSCLLSQPPPENVDDLVKRYNSVLRDLLDLHAPEKSCSVASRTTQPWVTDTLLEAKRNRRRSENLWRKTGLTVHRLEYRAKCEAVKSIIKRDKSDYFIKKIDDCNGDQKKLFQIVDKLLGRGRQSALPHFIHPKDLAQTFNRFFIAKITKIRETLSDLESSVSEMNCPLNSLLHPSSSKLHSFKPTTNDEVTTIIKKASKATCPLDPIPTNLLHNFLSVLAPVIVDIVNTSLSSGVFPSELKSAIIQPLLKKSGLDSEVLKNYRPVSNLSFISKVIEKVVASRLVEHMTSNNMLDPMQSAYRAGHSTETALLRVHNDVLTAIDNGSGVFLVLLDLSAAFDTVDHEILLAFLRDHIGLDGSVLQLMKSYLVGRTQCVSVLGVFSELCELLYGVPQGSVLGPIEFCIYTIPLGAIMRYYNIDYHIYADDTQLYCSFDLNSPTEAISRIHRCISDIRTWMIKNRLKINDDKTEFLVITSPRATFSDEVNLCIGQEAINPSRSCKSLGVMFDEHIQMDAFIRNTCRAAHYHLRNIGAVRNLLPTSAVIQLVHSLVTSRIDYCNSLLSGVPLYMTDQLQRVHNTAARIVTRSNPEHITPVLESLHWLKIRYRIRFKILLLTYKCINGLAPEYLSDLVIPYCPKRVLRSASQCRLKIQDSRLKTQGDRSFRVASQKEWNQLPLDIKLAPSVESFKNRLKTFLFTECFG